MPSMVHGLNDGPSKGTVGHFISLYYRVFFLFFPSFIANISNSFFIFVDSFNTQTLFYPYLAYT